VGALKHCEIQVKIMKKAVSLKLFVACLAVVVATTGCRTKRPDKNITPIPGVSGMDVEGPGAGGPLDGSGVGNTPAIPRGLGDGIGLAGGPGMTTGGLPPIEPLPIPQPIDTAGDGSLDMTYDIDGETGMLKDTSAFAANTIFFGYDSSVVRSAEVVKLDEIITIMKGQPATKLIVEGHCDERGTEEYNRALGERRANSIRDHLINAGIGQGRIRTLSYGEDKPKDFGHDEAAWAQNRRAEFVLLKPRL
jgi:peptidoglycan-associated lipoprotein